MKKTLIILFSLFSCTIAMAQQRTMSEGIVTYNLSVVTNSKEPEIADIFDGAVLNVYMKGNTVMSEMKSVLRNQSIIYDGKADTAVILRESGDQKFIINLNAADWQHYNRKYDGITYVFNDETKTVAGYSCKKAIGKLKDGTTFTVFYTPSIVVSVKNYDYQFKDLPGLALEYEVQNGNLKVKYSASKVSFMPVPQFKFDIPKSGYRILDYQRN
jgi:GLPGLI family protein